MVQGKEYGSLAWLFGKNSMEAWTCALLEDRRCMDCKKELEGFDGRIEFRGQPLHVELVGHLCESCWERREEVRRYHRSLTTR